MKHIIKDIEKLSELNPVINCYYRLYKNGKLTLEESLIGIIKMYDKMLNHVINENINLCQK
jgi:hypothetical protein